MAAVITEMLGKKINSQKKQWPPWRRIVEAKIKVAERDNYQSCRNMQ